jgi:hypothetical protein
MGEDAAMTSQSSASNAATKAIAAEIFSASQTDLSRFLLSHLGGSGTEIVSATVDPKGYTSADEFSRDYLCAELMSKFPYWDLGIDRAGVALTKFASSELQCLRANARLVDLGANSLITVTTERLLLRARRKIQDLLGEYSIREHLACMRFGPGATTSKTRIHRDVYYKIGDSTPECSFNLVPFLFYLRHELPLWDFEAKVARGSKVVTVPKNAKTDRTICVEPDLNVLVQLGLGSMIRRRLRNIGLLTVGDSQVPNQERAREGSILGNLATIDLSSASDTISRELVRNLVRSDWLAALETCRTPVAVLDGMSIPLEKFSAMGNGNTFELETLIFWGICSAVLESHPEWDQRVLVYGDDIIVDVRAVGLISQVFEEVGFTMNPKKTFSDGPFRESCGKHYFRGVDVTPYYIRKRLTTPLDWLWMANTIKRHARLSYGHDSRWLPPYKAAVSRVPPSLRMKIPEGYGDGGLVSDFDDACPPRAPHYLEGWTFRFAAPVQRYREVKGPARLAKSLFLLERGGVDIFSSLPLEPRGLKVAENVAARWPSYGPWL